MPQSGKPKGANGRWSVILLMLKGSRWNPSLQDVNDGSCAWTMAKRGTNTPYTKGTLDYNCIHVYAWALGTLVAKWPESIRP